MKKLFISFLIAGALVACNNSADTTAAKKDSVDSIASAKKDMVDSSASAKKDAIDSTADMKKAAIQRADSLMKHDTAHKGKM